MVGAVIVYVAEHWDWDNSTVLGVAATIEGGKALCTTRSVDWVEGSDGGVHAVEHWMVLDSSTANSGWIVTPYEVVE